MKHKSKKVSSTTKGKQIQHETTVSTLYFQHTSSMEYIVTSLLTLSMSAYDCINICLSSNETSVAVRRAWKYVNVSLICKKHIRSYRLLFDMPPGLISCYFPFKYYQLNKLFYEYQFSLTTMTLQILLPSILKKFVFFNKYLRNFRNDLKGKSSHAFIYVLFCF